MKGVPFSATVREVNGSFVVTIPKAYILNNLLHEGEEYRFTAEEVKA